MQDTQKLIQNKGEEILKRMESGSKVSLFSKDFWYGSIMDWSMKNEKFKTNMFRFVDVLPSLQSGSSVATHLKEYFTENGEELPSVFNVGLGLGSLAPGLMAGAIRKNVTQMAKMFITGENPQEALNVIKKARKNKITFTVDILGEATLSEKEALDYQRKYLELIDGLSKDASSWDEIPQIDRDHLGAIPKVNVSVKMTALYSQINDMAWDQTKATLKDRLRPVFHAGMQKNVFINLDMEHYGVKHLTVEVFKELINEPEFKNYPFFGCVVQAYLRDSYDDVQMLTDFAKARGTPFWIRLVKGAYWDSETIEAQQKTWAIPVYTKKAESDANYELCAKYLIDNHKHIRVAIASHNVRTISAVLVHAEKIGLPQAALEIQMLYGMAEPIKKALVEMGYRVREYSPVGELIPGMAYLVRRLLENTSNESWLRGKFADGKTTEQLLKDPSHGLIPSSEWDYLKGDQFRNVALLDFAIPENRQKMQLALDEQKALFGQKVFPIISGNAVSTDRFMDRKNPSHSDQIVSRIGMASVTHAETAIQIASESFKSWKKVSADERANMIDRLADLILRDRFTLCAVQIHECGKPWAEADGDITEAIDFCRYYAKHMRELNHPLKVGGVPGETSQYIYRPRGVTTVIAPWNFPLAIITGQVVSALVTGNTVIMKPAEQSSLMASHLLRLLLEAGIPKEAVHFIPGLGEEVGEYLVNHKLTSTIAFTGSKAVGLHILNKASQLQSGQKHLKRCIIEMGGKDPLIIDNDADLDEAVDATLYSAFGFAGQKCSALSRVIVLSEVYDRFVERLKEAAASIQMLPAENPKAYLGPVVDEESYERLLDISNFAKQNHQIIFEGENLGGGNFIPPLIVGNVQSTDRLATDEFFGPILAVIKAESLDQAIQIANQSEYALTGGIFSRSPANIQKVKEELEVGNLYVNRGITGAMVDRHPFGGFKLSGIGSKTGGPDYLKQFMEPITITENNMRRGFAPEE